MGGNIFKQDYSLKADRITLNEKTDIIRMIVPKIEMLLSFNTIIKEPLIVSEKQDFGDIDILISYPDKYDISNDLSKIHNSLAYKLNNEIVFVNNGTVKSFAYKFNDKIVEIDLIFIKESKWDISTAFYSNDPVGNIMGKLSRYYQCKFGFDGLVFFYRTADNITINIPISTNPQKIFDFLKLDYDKFNEGFNTYIDMYKFLSTSDIFFVEMFNDEYRRYIDRKRNKRRKSFIDFQQWIKDNSNRLNYEYNRPSQDELIQIVNNYFPESNLIDEINLRLNKILNTKIIRNKINVKIIADKLNLNVVHHGTMISNILNKFKKENGDEYLINNTNDKIMNDFMSFYATEHINNLI